MIVRLLNARTPDERGAVVRAHPELLGTEADDRLAALHHLHTTAAAGPDGLGIAAVIADRRRFLARCRQGGIEGAIAHDGVAELPDDLIPEVAGVGLWLRSRDPAPEILAGVLACADRVAGHSVFPCLAPGLRLQVLYTRAFARQTLGRHRLAMDDINQVIADWREVLAIAPAAWGGRPEALTALGSALSARYDASGRDADADEADTAFDAALRPLAEGSREYGVVLGNSGAFALGRYGRTGDGRHLEEAVGRLERAWAAIPAGADRVFVANNLAAAYQTLFDRSGERSHLDRAITAGEDAIRGTAAGPDRLARQVSLGAAYASRYDRFGGRADLDRAFDLLTPAAAGLAPGGDAWVRATRNLATAHRVRARDDRSRDDADAAIRLNQALLEAVPDGTAPRLLHHEGLGNSYQVRYDLGHDLDDLDTAIRAYRLALGDGAEALPERHRAWNNLGAALSSRYDVTASRSDLDEAITAFGQALKLLPPTAPQWADTRANLGGYLTARYEAGGADDDYRDGVAALDEAAARLAGSPRLAGVFNSRAAARFARWTRGGDRTDLAAAVADWEAALRSATSPAARGTPAGNLAVALADLHRLDGRPADRDRATGLFREATAGGSVDATLRAAHAWGDWAFDRAAGGEPGAWAEAREAFAAARAAADRLLQAQHVRQDRAEWVRRTQRLPGRQAYALARAGRAEAAAEALEAGRALFLTEALERNRADLDRLAAAGGQGLFDRYRRAAAAELADRGDQGPADLAAVAGRRRERRETADELSAVIEEIRRVPGYDDFLRPLSAAGLRAAAAAGPIVYLVVTTAGAVALVVTPDGVRPVLLPCNAEEIAGHLAAWTAGAEQPDDSAGVSGVLARVLPWLGERLMGPVAAALRPADAGQPVRLIPTGRLTLLPLHAARYPGPDGPTTFLDEFAVAYLPTARVLGAGRATATGPPLVVGDPDPAAGPLPFARVEAAAVAAAYPGTSPLVGGAATAAAIRAAWPHAAVAHLACHGVFDAGSPLLSALLLAGGERLTLGELLAGPAHGPGRVILSACQTALSDYRWLPEEVIGFPAGVLQSGARSVVATLWPVNDYSTSLLMTRFHASAGREPPADTLRSAQLWLRDLTPAAAAAAAERAFRSAGPAERPVLLRVWRHYQRATADDPAGRPFADPYHWAGFACWGEGG